MARSFGILVAIVSASALLAGAVLVFAGAQEGGEAADQATPVAVADGRETYVARLYGYTLAYDPSHWSIFDFDDPLDDYDDVYFLSGEIRIRLIGGADYARDGLADCLADHLESRGPPTAEGAGADRVWATVDAIENGEAWTFYLECRWLGGGVTLFIEQGSAVADYPRAVAAREELLAGLDPTGADVANAARANSPFDGMWEGQTAGGASFGFEVRRGRVYWIGFSYTCGGRDRGQSMTRQDGWPMEETADSGFLVEDSSMFGTQLEMTGTFASAETAEGTVTIVDGEDGCETSFAWTARRSAAATPVGG